jgi:hypothetical protein
VPTAFRAGLGIGHIPRISFIGTWASVECSIAGFSDIWGMLPRPMRFLQVNEIWAWCAEHGVLLESGDSHPATDSALTFRKRVRYASGRRSGREAEFATACTQSLGEWSECLLWVTLWGVWPSGEDWPRYYAARGLRNMRLSLPIAPGHWFARGDESDLHEFLTMVLEFAWDAYLLPVPVGIGTGVRVEISHDEWLEVQSASPVQFTSPLD